jgi:hypothetical protein
MNRFYHKFSILQIFGAILFMYFSVHLIYGYFYCIYSEYANCPGYFVDANSNEYEEEE